MTDKFGSKRIFLITIVLFTIGSALCATAQTIEQLNIYRVIQGIGIIVELRHKHPLLELRVFRSSDFTRGILLTWIVQIDLFGAMILMPVFLQQVRGYSALDTGLIMIPQALGSMLFMPIGGRLFDKIGAKPLALVGMTLVAGALLILTQIGLDTPLSMILLPLFMIGSGMGLSMMSLNTHVLNAAPRSLVSHVTPLTTAAQQVVTSFAVAGLTGYLTSRTTDHIAKIGQNGNPLEAAISAYADTFLLSTGLAIVEILLSFILRKPKPQPEDKANTGSEKTNPAMMMGH